MVIVVSLTPRTCAEALVPLVPEPQAANGKAANATTMVLCRHFVAMKLPFSAACSAGSCAVLAVDDEKGRSSPQFR
jgi:hypothetical protein